MARTTIDGTVNTTPAGAATAAYGAISVANTATVIVAANAATFSVSVNNSGAQTVWVGTDASVTTVNGMPIQPNAEREIRTKTGVWGIVASGTADVRYIAERSA